MADNALPQVSARVQADIPARLDVIAAAMVPPPGGKPFVRSDALRAAIVEGVRVLEERLGLAAKQTTAPLQPKPWKETATPASKPTAVKKTAKKK